MLQIRLSNRFNDFGKFDISSHVFYVRNMYMNFLIKSPVTLESNRFSYYRDDRLQITSAEALQGQFETQRFLTNKINGDVIINDGTHVYGYEIYPLDYSNYNVYDGTVFLSPKKTITFTIKNRIYTFKNIKYILQSDYEMDTRGQELACYNEFIKCYTVSAKSYYYQNVNRVYTCNEICLANKNGEILVELSIDNHGAFCGYLIKGLTPTCHSAHVSHDNLKIKVNPKLDHLDPYKDPNFNKFNYFTRQKFKFVENFQFKN